MESNLLLTVGAMALLAIFILSTNRLLLNNNEIVSESEYIVSTVSLGQTLIDEVKTKYFDENAITGNITSTSQLSSTLGRETGETSISFPDTSSISNFLSNTLYDDVDDYNGYWRVVRTPRGGPDTIRARVEYVDLTNPGGAASGVRTFGKRLTVRVKSPYIDSTKIPPVQLFYVFTY
ncbi:MAG: hypothetical protein A2V66_12475 [Ignavibacteria bacterium RBG_13_36_8]|nr:MAG: hypothetical protein A2V66_12475 [Ignavibacteria bacterium RBG_13_36_8]